MYRTRYYAREGGGSTATEDETSTETNYLFAFADTLVANVVPPNPKVTIKANRQVLEDSAKFRSALVNRIFDRERLSSKLWKAATRASVWPRAFIKTVWSETHKRPIFRVISPQYVLLDLQAEDWEDVRYIGEISVLTKSEFKRRLKKKGKAEGHYRADAEKEVVFGEYPKWLEPDDDAGDAQEDVDIVRGNYQWTVVYEIYDLVAQKFYHFADGVDRPLMVSALPYKFLPNPFTMLVFNDNLRDIGGMSDAELVYPTIERINEMKALEMWHCKTAIPITTVHGALVDAPDQLQESLEAVDGPGQSIIIDAKQNVGINEVVGQTPVPSLPVEWQRIQQGLAGDVEFVLGMPAYQRGQVGQSDVATELALTDTATRTRNARRQQVIYNAISWCARAVIALYQENMNPDESIPVRLVDGADETELTRELMAFGHEDSEDGQTLTPLSDDPWAYDYSANAYNASAENDVTRLKQLEIFLPVLQNGVQMGLVDGRELMKQLTELLRMPELLAEPAEEQQPQMMPPGAMPQPGAPKAAEVLPGNMPPEAAAFMGGGNEVTQGSGSQKVPGGMEGGTAFGPTGG